MPMPRVKTLLIVSFVIVLSLSLMGCSLLGSRSEQAEITAGLESDLPGWLLLSHRSAADDNIVNLKEEPAEEEEEEVVEDVEVEIVAEQQTPTEQPTEQPAPSTTPPQTEQPTSSSGAPSPGTREYMAWFAANGAKGEYNVDMMQWYAETQGGTTQSYAAWKEAKEKEEAAGGTGGGGWFDDDSGSPSGWGD